jgi:glutamine synthetase
MHLHQSVLDHEGRNIFSDETGGETARFHQFLAGLQAHLPAMMLIFAPYVNSYRRFLRHSQAPVSAAWGRDNRTTALRVPHSAPAARRVENRVAGADTNPYLVIAASLAAGLAGIEDGLPPTPALEGSAYAGEPRRDLPRNLDEAVDLFAASPLAARMFGDRFVTGFVALKNCEIDHWQREISAWERRYLGPAI